MCEFDWCMLSVCYLFDRHCRILRTNCISAHLDFMLPTITISLQFQSRLFGIIRQNEEQQQKTIRFSVDIIIDTEQVNRRKYKNNESHIFRKEL